jgi:GntR family transcriptional repressor for pyruvate dehydrogenase complex
MPMASQNPVERRTLIDDLTQAMLDFISDGGYIIGDKLPPITALAKIFSVAAPTIREMARRLESTGVLSIRHGSGIYLAGDVERLVFTNPSRGLLSHDTMLELLDTRLLIEPELASRAAAMRTTAQIDELEAIAHACGDAINENNLSELNRLNMSFHIQVGRIAGNKVLSESLETVIELHMDQQRKIASLFADTERDREEHTRILAAITAGDSAEARRLMETHLAEVLDIVKGRIKEDLKENK